MPAQALFSFLGDVGEPHSSGCWGTGSGLQMLDFLYIHYIFGPETSRNPMFKMLSESPVEPSNQ